MTVIIIPTTAFFRSVRLIRGQTLCRVNGILPIPVSEIKQIPKLYECSLSRQLTYCCHYDDLQRADYRLGNQLLNELNLDELAANL